MDGPGRVAGEVHNYREKEERAGETTKTKSNATVLAHPGAKGSVKGRCAPRKTWHSDLLAATLVPELVFGPRKKFVEDL